jgi:hypothetical protein
MKIVENPYDIILNHIPTCLEEGHRKIITA